MYYGVLLGIYFIPDKKPEDIIKSNLNLTIPTKSKIIHFDYNRWSGKVITKIQIESQDIADVNKDFLNYFVEEYTFRSKKDISFKGKSFASWWDIDRNNIETCYKGATDGKKYFFQVKKLLLFGHLSLSKMMKSIIFISHVLNY